MPYSNNISAYCISCFILHGTVVVIEMPLIILWQYPIAFMSSTLKRICEWQPSFPHCLCDPNGDY